MIDQTPSLAVDLAGLKLRNPVMPASGTFGYGAEFKSSDACIGNFWLWRRV